MPFIHITYYVFISDGSVVVNVLVLFNEVALCWSGYYLDG